MKFATRMLLGCTTSVLIVLTAGVALGQATVAGGTPEGAQMKNPVPDTRESIDAGPVVYLEKCAPCHGERGDGHGKAVGEYGTPPADLTRPSYTYGTADGDVFDVIKYGVQPRLAMPGWDGLVSDTDIWNVINYLRTLRSQPKEN